MRTYAVKAQEIDRKWHVIDAAGQTLGRLATVIAMLLRGKHKAMFSPHLDTGDFVIVVNAAKIHVTGKKETEKMYYRHSGYPGGLRKERLADARRKHPERIIEHAVRGMLPHNAIGKTMRGKLKVYGGPEHPHQAQQPVAFDVKSPVARSGSATATKGDGANE